MISNFLRVILFAVLAMSTQAYAAGDAAQGAITGETCLGCHGVTSYSNVYPTYRVPKLGGQHAEYLAAALKAYRSGERKHPTMQAQSARLTDQQINDIAAYFASIKE